jgi:hypothetical protein
VDHLLKNMISSVWVKQAIDQAAKPFEATPIKNTSRLQFLLIKRIEPWLREPLQIWHRSSLFISCDLLYLILFFHEVLPGPSS